MLSITTVRTLGLFAMAFAIGLACLARNVFEDVPNVVILAPAAVVCLVAAYWLGIRRSDSSQPMRGVARGAMWASAAVVLLVLPIALRWISVMRVIDSIPITPDATRIEQAMELGLLERTRWWCRTSYVTHLPFDNANEFLCEEFNANGWEIDDVFAERTFVKTEPFIVSAAPHFGHPPVDGRVQCYTFERFPNERLLVWLTDVGDERWFEAAWMK